MWNNVKRIIGGEPEPEPTIGDMKPGDQGYCVPWAYQDGRLDTGFPVHSRKGGTASLWVECIAPGEYAIEFEEPVYRNPFTGEWSGDR